MNLDANSLTTKRKQAGQRGGLATLAKHGRDHFSAIGKKGAAVFWKRYHMAPAGTSGWVIVNRETGKVKATIGSLPFALLLVLLLLPSLACSLTSSLAPGAMVASMPTITPTPGVSPALPTPTDTATPTHETTCTVTAAEALNLRAGPGTSYQVIDWLKPGQVLTVIDQAGTWIQVTTPTGAAGWVNLIYCSKGQ